MISVIHFTRFNEFFFKIYLLPKYVIKKLISFFKKLKNKVEIKKIQDYFFKKKYINILNRGFLNQARVPVLDLFF